MEILEGEQPPDGDVATGPITTRYMTKYEKARVLGTRALQIRCVRHAVLQRGLCVVRCTGQHAACCARQALATQQLAPPPLFCTTHAPAVPAPLLPPPTRRAVCSMNAPVMVDVPQDVTDPLEVSEYVICDARQHLRGQWRLFIRAWWLLQRPASGKRQCGLAHPSARRSASGACTIPPAHAAQCTLCRLPCLSCGKRRSPSPSGDTCPTAGAHAGMASGTGHLLLLLHACLLALPACAARQGLCTPW